MVVHKYTLEIKKKTRVRYSVEALASNGLYIIAATNDQGAVVLDRDLNKVAVIEEGKCFSAAHASLSFLAAVSCDGTVVVYNSGTKEYTAFESEHTFPDLVLVTKDDVIVCSDRCTRYTHDGRRLNSIPTGWVAGRGTHFEDILYLPSPQQQKLIVADKDMVLAKIPIHEDVYALSRGSMLLAAGTAEHVILFTLERPLRPMETLRKYTGSAVGSVAVRRDGQMIAYALTERNDVVVMDAEAREVAKFSMFEDPTSVAWVGNDIVVGDEDGYVQILTLTPR